MSPNRDGATEVKHRRILAPRQRRLMRRQQSAGGSGEIGPARRGRTADTKVGNADRRENTVARIGQNETDTLNNNCYDFGRRGTTA
jgi:hypothetical protein